MDNQKNKNLISRGKRLAFLLRHDKNYQFDEHGWREISNLITSYGYTMDELKEIVETNNKQRYEFSEDMTRIRARQGHSVLVDVELEEKLRSVSWDWGTIPCFYLGKRNQQGEPPVCSFVRDQRDSCKCRETSWEPCCAGHQCQEDG